MLVEFVVASRPFSDRFAGPQVRPFSSLLLFKNKLFQTPIRTGWSVLCTAEQPINGVHFGQVDES